MNGFGGRLRMERKRLGLSQTAFGKLGGVATSAQGKYEGGKRLPKGIYLEALNGNGVDVIFVLTGTAAAKRLDGLSRAEQRLVANCRALTEDDFAAVSRIARTLAQASEVDCAEK